MKMGEAFSMSVHFGSHGRRRAAVAVVAVAVAVALLLAYTITVSYTHLLVRVGLRVRLLPFAPGHRRRRDGEAGRGRRIGTRLRDGRRLFAGGGCVRGGYGRVRESTLVGRSPGTARKDICRWKRTKMWDTWLCV